MTQNGDPQVGKGITPITSIDGLIHTIRGQRVMVDADLAKLYGVETKVFNQAARRHKSRFPEDFRFQLTKEEADCLRSQSVTSNGRGGRRHLPWVFTEQGVAMLSGILNSPEAVSVNIEIMRAFVRLRRAVSSQARILQRLGLVEAHIRRTSAELGHHQAEVRQALKTIFAALRGMNGGGPLSDNPPIPIGFDLT